LAVAAAGSRAFRSAPPHRRDPACCFALGGFGPIARAPPHFDRPRPRPNSGPEGSRRPDGPAPAFTPATSIGSPGMSRWRCGDLELRPGRPHTVLRPGSPPTATGPGLLLDQRDSGAGSAPAFHRRSSPDSNRPPYRGRGRSRHPGASRPSRRLAGPPSGEPPLLGSASYCDRRPFLLVWGVRPSASPIRRALAAKGSADGGIGWPPPASPPSSATVRPVRPSKVVRGLRPGSRRTPGAVHARPRASGRPP